MREIAAAAAAVIAVFSLVEVEGPPRATQSLSCAACADESPRVLPSASTSALLMCLLMAPWQA